MNIPEYVLNLKVRTFDDEFVKLEKLLLETTDQNVEHAEYIVSFDEKHGDTLEKFSSWTKDHIIVLVKTAHGSYLLKHDRNYKESP